MKAKFITNISGTFIWAYVIPFLIFKYHPILAVNMLGMLWLAVAGVAAVRFFSSKKKFNKTQNRLMLLGPLILFLIALITLFFKN
ncbi:hypothetical protein KAJ89_05125 [Candidatus Parcubacteria bacterium]|nr:hypothetical protein [Candidatus Parcubacteria bacterium]